MDLSESEIVLELMLNSRRSGVIILITLNIAAVQKMFLLGSNESQNIISENTSVIVDRKKEFLYKLCLILKREILSAFFVKHKHGINLQGYSGVLLFQIL